MAAEAIEQDNRRRGAAGTVHVSDAGPVSTIKLDDRLCWINAARFAPSHKLDGVDAPITGLGLLNERVMPLAKLSSELWLCQSSIYTPLAQQRTHSAIRKVVLWPCSHCGTKVELMP
ncbi:MAG: hypothetical protein L0Y44_16730 [Phycisphaerales bacterium]|nr:hypothetical protein [Phycisphaerales bacterium]MCI0632290.1 hypothetical protein [Phycisphaerales bacterium]MCI0675401.1 hypothetical protein [Phycisphaerales bacterium]